LLERLQIQVKSTRHIAFLLQHKAQVVKRVTIVRCYPASITKLGLGFIQSSKVQMSDACDDQKLRMVSV